ncbi:unnamed protein product [Amoebophrya sp. A120]|nr:unnamed protein product [Amoebophrya sp. A120]|eukprot:GSA120T00016773001.1
MDATRPSSKCTSENSRSDFFGCGILRTYLIGERKREFAVPVSRGTTRFTKLFSCRPAASLIRTDKRAQVKQAQRCRNIYFVMNSLRRRPPISSYGLC